MAFSLEERMAGWGVRGGREGEDADDGEGVERAGAGMANWSRVGITGYMINRYDV
jgi:hypothetical protein